MAKLPDLALAIAFELRRQRLACVDEIAALEWHLSEQLGEIEPVLAEPDNLQSIRDRARDAYARLNILLQRLAEVRPQASSAMLERLEWAIRFDIVLPHIPKDLILGMQGNHG